MKRISFKRHKKFLKFLKLVFLKFFSKTLKFFKCYGFLFKLKGKIGVAGNAKKRKFFFSKKRYSFTRKNTKITFYKMPLTTHTGALGVKFLISFF